MLKKRHVNFLNIERGKKYSRLKLAKLWGYKSYEAIARGVVTPRGDNKIILFVTENKQPSAEPYKDRLSGSTLTWEGPKNHFGEARIIAADESHDEIHLFYRFRHHDDFLYLGLLTLDAFHKTASGLTRFRFSLA